MSKIRIAHLAGPTATIRSPSVSTSVPSAVRQRNRNGPVCRLVPLSRLVGDVVGNALFE